MARKQKITLFILATITIGAVLGLSALGLKAFNQMGGSDQKPITTENDKVGSLLQKWWKEGTAAGNVGDYYDNRDGDHSPLDLKRYPQLSAIKYSPDDIRLGKHWAVARIVLPHVTFGNSSTSAPAHLTGSNPRNYYVSKEGLAFLYTQYTKNNLYIYPEHQDHDPGHNGVYLPTSGPRDQGHGDLYPTNTPYLLISQGSSGSDQPFMRMMPFVLAAFRPDVKKKLTETGLLMPTIQMLLRSTNKHLKDPKEYLTGKAHPTVFEGSWVDELAMVQKAHEMELKALPPMVQLRVVEEDQANNGTDFFEPPGATEILGNTPDCIARIHRGKAYQQRLVVNADASFDVNKAKLTYTWVILRGDPDKINIVPKNDNQSTAEIKVAYHDRRPVSPGSPLESNRVDIGVFVHNGTYYSAPAFITFFTLDHEARAYDENGVLREIGYGTGETEVYVANWAHFLSQLGTKDDLAKLLDVSKEQRGALLKVAEEQKVLNGKTQAIHARIARMSETMKSITDALEKKKADFQFQEAFKDHAVSQKAEADALDRKDNILGDTPRHFVDSRMAKLTKDPLFMLKHADWLTRYRTPTTEGRFVAHGKRLTDLGIANNREALTPLIPGKKLADAKWTAFERARLEYCNASLIADLALPGTLNVIWRTNYVDSRLSAPREWRDVYRYGPKGEYLGWTRYSAAGMQLFNHDGLLVVEKDGQSRCVKGRAVRYARVPGTAPNQSMLQCIPGDTIMRYEFAGPDDMRGRRAGTESAKDKK